MTNPQNVIAPETVESAVASIRKWMRHDLLRSYNDDGHVDSKHVALSEQIEFVIAAALHRLSTQSMDVNSPEAADWQAGLCASERAQSPLANPPNAPTDETWKRAVDCAASQFESYVRQEQLETAQQRRSALDDALQHAIGILQMAASHPTQPPSTSAAADENGWLIETGDQQYWNGKHANADGFIRNVNDAVRFARFEDSERVIHWLMQEYRVFLRSSQHKWVGNREATLPPSAQSPLSQGVEAKITEVDWSETFDVDGVSCRTSELDGEWLIASSEQSPRFCFGAATKDDVIAKAKRGISFHRSSLARLKPAPGAEAVAPNEYPSLTDTQLIELEKQLVAAEAEILAECQRGSIKRGPAMINLEFKSAEYIRRLLDHVKSYQAALRSPAIPAPAQGVTVTQEMVDQAAKELTASERVYFREWTDLRPLARAVLEAALHPEKE